MRGAGVIGADRKGTVLENVADWNWIIVIIALLVGASVGILVVYFAKLIRVKTTKELADEVFRETQERRREARNVSRRAGIVCQLA